MEFDIFLLAALAFLLLVMISSGRRRKKQAQQLTDSLVVGAKVMTHAGIIGTIVEVLDDEVMIESGPRTKLRVVKQAIRTSQAPEVVEAETSEAGKAKKPVAKRTSKSAAEMTSASASEAKPASKRTSKPKPEAEGN